MNSDNKTKFCIFCGKEIKFGAIKCKYCHNFLRNPKSEDLDLNQDVGGESHTVAIVLGYIFCFLGGLIGLIISLYLLTRDSEDAKKHGKIQLVLLVLMFIFWFIIFA